MKKKEQVNGYNEYMSEYLRSKTRRISLNLSLVNDKDILQAIEETDPKNTQGAVKDLIRKGIQYELYESLHKSSINIEG